MGEIYGLQTGGRECELVDKNIIQKLCINLTEFTSAEFKDKLLSSLTHDERTRVFNSLVLIKPKTELDFTNVTKWEEILEQATEYTKQKDIFQQYIRIRKDGGVSDDMACMAAAYIDFDPQIHIPQPKIFTHYKREQMWQISVSHSQKHQHYMCREDLTKF